MSGGSGKRAVWCWRSGSRQPPGRPFLAASCTAVRVLKSVSLISNVAKRSYVYALEPSRGGRGAGQGGQTVGGHAPMCQLGLCALQFLQTVVAFPRMKKCMQVDAELTGWALCQQ